MAVLFIIYGIIASLLGLVGSGAVAWLFKDYRKATWLFVVANFLGFCSGLVYFIFLPSHVLTIIEFESFLNFTPQITSLSAIFFSLTSGIAALVGIYSVRYLHLYRASYNPNLLQGLMSFFVLGMQGVVLASNSFSFLFFWELMSIISFFLVLSDKSKESVKAAFLYFIMTHLGASAILGAFLILGQGSIFFNLSDLRIATQNLSPTSASLAFALFIFGFGSKAGLVPFHVWLPEAHPQAPSNISALMSGLMLKIAIYGFILIILGFANVPTWAGLTVIVLGLLSGVVGVLNAVTKRDIKTAFAYSSIENMGIIFTMLGLALYFLVNPTTELVAYLFMAFAIIHAISHSLFKTGLFLSSGVIINRVHSKSLEKMGGLAKLMPVFAGAFLLTTLSSLPIPPFGTFYGEWGLVQNIILQLHQNISSPGTIVILILTLSLVGIIGGLAIFAMIKIFSISMLGLPHNKKMETRAEKEDYLLILPIFILGIGGLVLGVFASSLISALIKMLEKYSSNISNSLSVTLNISSLAVTGMVIITAALVYIINKIFFNFASERTYKTWDCGQPTDDSMQYSATAFVAPIRYFFLVFIGRRKTVSSEPVVATNKWIRNYKFRLYIRSVWIDALYQPITKGLYMLAEKIRLIQSGRIQYYILFLLIALIATLIFAL